MAETKNWEKELASPEMKANPYPVFKQLREECPIYYSEHFQSWLVTRYKDADAVFKSKTVSSNTGPLVEKQILKAGVDAELLKKYTHYDEPVFTAEGTQHSKRRKVASKAFTPKAARGYEPIIKGVVTKALDKLAGKTEIDIYKDFSAEFPYKVISTLMGVPNDMYEKFHHWVVASEQLVVGIWEAKNVEENEEVFVKGNEAHEKTYAFLTELARERKANPSNDMLSYMVSKESSDDEDISLGMISKIASVVMAAGSSTIALQFPLIVHSLLLEKNKDKLLVFKDNINDDAFVANAIDEIMRVNATALFVHRITTEDMEVAGKMLEKGSIIALAMASANHDEEVFPNPTEIDFNRPNSKFQMGFGSGVHFCLGKHLAIIEMRTALRELFARYPNIRLNPDITPEYSRDVVTLRGLSSLSLLVD